MKRQLFILAGLLFCVIITGCKKTHCPAFPKAIANTYFPYTENSVLSYSSINGDTLAFKINFYELTDSYSFAWNCKCACSAHASFHAESDPLSLKINGLISLGDNNAGIDIDIDIDFHEHFSGNTAHFFIDGINPYASNVWLFGDTINLTTKNPNKRISSVQIIADKGITRFFDREQDCEWTLVEDSF